MKPQLLVVDDNVELCLMTAKLLQREGFDAEVCYNGEEAMDLIKGGNSYDLIITDLIMPKKDGVELITFVKDHSPETPVIVFSGGGITLSVHESLKSVEGLVSGVLAKPVDPGELIDMITNSIGECG